MSKAIFESIGNAKTTTRSNHIKEGKGTLLVKKIECRELEAGTTFIVEAEVLESEQTGANPPNLLGSTIGYIQQLLKFKAAAGNVKAFTQALVGEPDADGSAIAKVLEELCGPKQPGTGMLIKYETFQQTTKTGPNAGSVNTYPRFFHVAQTGPEIKKRREALEAV